METGCIPLGSIYAFTGFGNFHPASDLDPDVSVMNPCAFAIYSLFCVTLAVPAVTAGNLTITVPSVNESTFAELRGLLRYGGLSGTSGTPPETSVSSSRDDSGAVVRTVMSSVNVAGITPVAR
jgi:hypothetical protein